MRTIEVVDIRPTGEVHPVADLFPMMTDDELDDLAADISANGLLNPIVIDLNGVLIDGRNRLAGCVRAKVEPEFTQLNGHDPTAFIIASNVARRHLSKGQQAAVIVEAEFLVSKNCDGLKGKAAEKAGVSKARISQAVLVKEYRPGLLRAVIAGSETLDKAYEEARNQKLADEGRESSLSRLQAEAPDIAALVQEERLTLAEGLSALSRRRHEERAQIEAITRNFHNALTLIDPLKVSPDEAADTWLKARPELIGDHADFSAHRARRAADVLMRYAQKLETKER